VAWKTALHRRRPRIVGLGAGPDVAKTLLRRPALEAFRALKRWDSWKNFARILQNKEILKCWRISGTWRRREFMQRRRQHWTAGCGIARGGDLCQTRLSPQDGKRPAMVGKFSKRTLRSAPRPSGKGRQAWGVAVKSWPTVAEPDWDANRRQRNGRPKFAKKAAE